MHNSKLIDLLKHLSTRERSKFRDYVFSPFFNKNKKVRALCELLIENAPEFSSPDLEKEKVYEHIFQKKKFNELQINNIISDLLQLLYDFLAYYQYEQREVLQKNFLVQELLEREITEHTERTLRRYQQLYQKKTFRNYEHFAEAYLLHEQLDRQALTKDKRKYDQNLQHKNDNLDLYYFSNKLRIACDMASRNTVVKAGYQCHFLNNILEYYEKNEQQLQTVPALSVYYKTLQMLQNSENSTHYFDLKKLLSVHLPLFPQKELRILYNYALNYCVKKINFGQSDYYREILDLYKILLEQNIIFKNGYLTQWTYINIITAGIRLKEYEWTENFIHQYKTFLLPEEQHNVFTYNLAAFYYAKGERSQALQLLQDVAFTDSFYHTAAKIIQLKSYYDLDETEAFFALIEAFKKYLLRDRQFSDYQKKSNQNFLKMATRIYDLRLKKGIIKKSDFRQRLRKLKTQLEQIEPVGNKGWLAEVLDSLGIED